MRKKAPLKPRLRRIEVAETCGHYSADGFDPDFPPLVCTLSAGHAGMHHQYGVPCSWLEKAA